jgi:acylphosphatase
MIVRRKVTVQGVVQMVSFRAFTEAVGGYLGLSGTSQNIETDKVEIFIEGEESAVNLFTKCATYGPRHARVDGITIDEAEVTGEKGFKIIYPKAEPYIWPAHKALDADLSPTDCLFCEKAVTEEQVSNGDAILLAEQWYVHYDCYQDAIKV